MRGEKAKTFITDSGQYADDEEFAVVRCPSRSTHRYLDCYDCEEQGELSHLAATVKSDLPSLSCQLKTPMDRHDCAADVFLGVSRGLTFLGTPESVKSMNTAIGIAMMAAGLLLVIFGFNESQSLSSDVSRVFTGSPTDRSMWMLIGGAVAAVLGIAMIFMGRRKI